VHRLRDGARSAWLKVGSVAWLASGSARRRLGSDLAQGRLERLQVSSASRVGLKDQFRPESNGCNTNPIIDRVDETGFNEPVNDANLSVGLGVTTIGDGSRIADEDYDKHSDSEGRRMQW